MKNFVAVYIILAIFCMQLEGMENNSISYEFKSRITALAVAQDGDSLVVGLETGQVTFFDIKKSELFSYWSNKTPVTALAMGNYIAVGYENGDLCVLDSKMRELYDLERHEKAIKKVVVDGTFMASFDNECAKIWDLLNGRCIAVLSFKKSVQAVALSSQFQKIFAAVDDSILGYDFRKSENLKPLEGHGGTIVSLSIADGLMFSATDNGSVRIWDLSSHECIKKFHIEPHIKAIKVDSDRRILVVVYKDNAVAWDCPTGKVLDKIIVSQHIPSMIAIGCDTIVSGSDEKSISIQKIAGYTFSVIIKNELNERIENFQLLDYEMHSCAKPFSCDPHEHKQVSISSIDSFRDWFISFTCNGEIVTTQIDQPLVPLREIMLTYNLRDGTILASIEPWVAKRFLKLFYQTKFPASSDKDDLEFPILTVGKPIKKITLIDKNGGQVDAVKDDKLQDKWNILKSHRYAPYRLCIETEDDKKYEWKIPFLFDHIEGVLSLPKEPQPVKARSLTSSFSKIPTVQPGRMRSMSTPAIYITGERVYLNVSKKPIFSLYEEASAQEFRVSGCLQCQAEVEDLHMIRYIEV